jgi:hypothetical protein
MEEQDARFSDRVASTLVAAVLSALVVWAIVALA